MGRTRDRAVHAGTALGWQPMSKIMLRLGLIVRGGEVLSVVHKYQYEENDKTFALTPIEFDGEMGQKRRIAKKEFTVVSSHYREDSSVVSYFIYCFPEDKSDCFYSLVKAVKKRLQGQIAGLQKELEALDKFKP